MQDFKLRFSCDRSPSIADIASMANVTIPCIYNHQNDQLLKPVEENEIWEAVKSIGALKAPGPDRKA